MSQNIPAQPGTHINLTYKKNWKKFREWLLDLLLKLQLCIRQYYNYSLYFNRQNQSHYKENRLILFCNGIHRLVEILTDTDNLQRPLRTTKNMQSTLSQISSQDQNTEIQLSPKHNQRLETFYRKTSSTRLNLLKSFTNIVREPVICKP